MSLKHIADSACGVVEIETPLVVTEKCGIYREIWRFLLRRF